MVNVAHQYRVDFDFGKARGESGIDTVHHLLKLILGR